MSVQRQALRRRCGPLWLKGGPVIAGRGLGGLMIGVAVSPVSSKKTQPHVVSWPVMPRYAGWCQL